MDGNKNKINEIQEPDNNDKVKMKQGMKFLTVQQCAEMLGLSKSTVYMMLRNGRIEGAFRVNRSWRIPMIARK